MKEAGNQARVRREAMRGATGLRAGRHHPAVPVARPAH